MDPNATLRELLEALVQREWDRAQELSEALLGWMSMRGFPPTTLGALELGIQWHRTIATFVCYAAQGKVKAVRRRERKHDT